MALDPQRWTVKTREAFQAATTQAAAAGNPYVTPAHLLAGPAQPGRRHRTAARRRGGTRSHRDQRGAQRKGRARTSHRRRHAAWSLGRDAPGLGASRRAAPRHGRRVPLGRPRAGRLCERARHDERSTALSACATFAVRRASRRRIPKRCSSRSTSTDATSPHSRARASSTR